jgi:hypothetical protein
MVGGILAAFGGDPERAASSYSSREESKLEEDIVSSDID